MPSAARKFLMAGKSGLNLTHAEPLENFLSRYGQHRTELEPIISAFDPEALRDWAQDLGVDTFIGSSGRVFPQEMKAAPLLRAWLHRLRASGVRFHMRHQWLGFAGDNQHRFMTPEGEVLIAPGALVLALGGGSWSRLGSTAAWVPILSQAGVPVSALKPSNCGFEVAWSSHLRDKFAGEPVKSVILSFTDRQGVTHKKSGDFVISRYGIEGSLVYAFSSAMVDAIEHDARAVIEIDLAPDLTLQRVVEKLSSERGKRSLAEFLRRQLGISGVKAALLHENVDKQILTEPYQLAARIKALPIVCERPRLMDEAISTSGGVAWEAMTQQLMLKKLPGVFCAGEMLDWDAPTGGYLLTACFASGVAAGKGVAAYCLDKYKKTI
jgi:uncharacterized flavoprotein (TIGR03862 family)